MRLRLLTLLQVSSRKQPDKQTHCGRTQQEMDEPPTEARAHKQKWINRMNCQIARSVDEFINYHRRPASLRGALITLNSAVGPCGATGTITRADLSGPWAATWIGNSGCGFGTNYFTFNLNTSGSGSGTDIGLFVRMRLHPAAPLHSLLTR